ncbi:hypothetical protein [Aureibaculum luteum]|uniref:hypothetical protein n=1 Tax=Aureibaculum luteum TaxID=1548456 RepID=UPI001300438F|nr:hypothetical protein [Aureibaculum luteum]
MQKKTIDEIIEDISNMEDNQLKNLNEWAIKGEFYEVCQGIKEVLDSRNKKVKT